jgi:hypothetical protein
MKYFVSMLVLSTLFCGANAAQNARPSVVSKMVAPVPRTASVNQLNGVASANGASVVSSTETEVDRREAEKNACINNNIGIGNTFVWASRYSNTSDYAVMTEDMDNPQNNVCFTRVELRSDDSKISVADVPAKYFMWGESIECGSWANEKEMEKRILDAKKGARIGGIVASTVGGAGLGVGAMELFGNRAIGGAVMGQKSDELSDAELYRSQLLVLQKQNYAEYKRIVDALTVLKHESVDDDTKKLIDEFVK